MERDRARVRTMPWTADEVDPTSGGELRAAAAALPGLSHFITCMAEVCRARLVEPTRLDA